MTSQTIHLAKGNSKKLSFNHTSGKIVLREAVGVRVFHVADDAWTPFEAGVELPAPLAYEGLIRVEGVAHGVGHAILEHRENGELLTVFRIEAHVYRVMLALDVNRDGAVDFDHPGRANWVWGPNQIGAVLLVNNDKDISDAAPTPGQFSEWLELRVASTLTGPFPEGVSLHLRASENAAKRFTVYRADGDTFEPILGTNPRDPHRFQTLSPPLSSGGAKCFVEGHELPGPFFEGLITIELVLIDQVPVAEDRVVVRTAPWIMTPNTLPPEKVFVCAMSTGNPNNVFVEGLKTALTGLGVPLEVIPSRDHLGDRWIQDEIEFGYLQGPTHTIPVVFDSPRDRGLDLFPERNLLGPDFGHFQIGGSTPNSLDSFGNLQVSPPVTVRGQRFPFGRVVFGGRSYGEYGEHSRQMMPELRRFLYAQKVQAPFELYSDWLSVGHVDEFLCFLPAENEKGFQALVASPNRAQSILQRLAAEGHGDAILFKGMRRGKATSGTSAEITVDALLAKEVFWAANTVYQGHLDLNVEILMQELEIDDRHVINIPVLFWEPFEDGRTAAFFPDMVNQLVLGHASLVPKPHGPAIDGEDVFEAAFRAAVPDRQVIFLDDWYAYHEMLGEIHCGTNVLRTPFPNNQWWNHRPVGGFDI